MLRGNCVCRKRSAIQRGMPGGVTFQFLRLVCRRKIDASRRPRVRRVRKIPKLCPANANDRASALLDAASADGRRIDRPSEILALQPGQMAGANPAVRPIV
jgi:hypothetical protein